MALIKFRIFSIILSLSFFVSGSTLATEDIEINKFINKTIFKPTSYKLAVPLLSQLDPLYIPMGCECVAENMAFKYYGIEVETKSLVDSLSHSFDPRLGFIGNMYATQNYFGTTPTIWPEGLISQVKQYRPNSFIPYLYKIEDLESEIANGHPVIVWYAWEPTNLAILTASGPVYSSSALHAVLLVGYEKNYWYVNDPVLGERKIEKNNFYKKYVSYGSRALVVR